MIRIKNQEPLKAYGTRSTQQFETAFSLGSTAKAYLRSIIEAKSEHKFEGWKYLAFSSWMRDKMKHAALTVNQKVSFVDTSRRQTHLDPAHWVRRRDGIFACKTADYAKAVSAALADSSKNGLECKFLSHLVCLRALQLAIGNERFNKLLQTHLGNKRLEVSANDELLEQENLTDKRPGSKYDGDAIFRPGDIVAFSNSRAEAAGTAWQVENGVCIGWKETTKGMKFDEPLFVGGGVPSVFTEAEMKEHIYRQTPASDLTADRTAHLAEKAIQGPKCSHKLDERDANGRLKYGNQAVPDISLYPYIVRIKILGGRKDL